MESINQLPERDYSNPNDSREQVRVHGQRSAISLIDTQDQLDMLRMHLIDVDPESLEYMKGEPMSLEDLQDWSIGSKDQFLFAIRGSSGVNATEIGELQGWVQFYPEDESRLKTLVEKDIIPELENDAVVIETSYAKYPDAAAGQIGSGLRQSLLRLPQELERRNPAQAGIHEKKVIVTAYVDPINQASIRVLEASGFVRRGEVLYDDTETTPDFVYILDWDKLYEKADKAVFANLSISPQPKY